MFPETLPSLDGIFSDSGVPRKNKLNVPDNRRMKTQKEFPEHKPDRLEQSPGGDPNSTREYDEIVAQMSDRSRQVEASLARTEAQLQTLENTRPSYAQGTLLPTLKAKKKNPKQRGTTISTYDEDLLKSLEQKYPEYADSLSSSVSRPHTSAEIQVVRRPHTSATVTLDIRASTPLLSKSESAFAASRKKKRRSKSRAREPPSSEQPGVGMPTENDAGQACSSNARPFFQYIDVQFPGPFSAPDQMIVEGSPEWVRKDWDQLYYIPNLPAKPKTGMEKRAWPEVAHVPAQV
eukprot:gene27246-33551_t